MEKWEYRIAVIGQRPSFGGGVNVVHDSHSSGAKKFPKLGIGKVDRMINQWTVYLNKLGEEGWMLVNAYSWSSEGLPATQVFVFKRPKE